MRLVIDILAAIIVLTGVDDYISDGETVLRVSNGDELVRRPASSDLIPRVSHVLARLVVYMLIE